MTIYLPELIQAGIFIPNEQVQTGHPRCGTPKNFAQTSGILNFVFVYISKAKKYRQRPDGVIETVDYYRLTRSYRDAAGKVRKQSVLCLGELDGYSKDERDELADILASMIETGQCILSYSGKIYEFALEMYAKYRDSNWAMENDPIVKAEVERKKQEMLDNAVTIRLDSLTQHEARAAGAESICNSTMQKLGIREFLKAEGWSSDDINLALMQIVSRAIYPYSENKTVKYLHENTSLPEMFGISLDTITKDRLYASSLRLWAVHRRLEDWLHDRVCSMFNIEEKILIYDISNTHFEGRKEGSALCKFGRNKQKRNDCKQVVLAAVVNTEGLIVRTSIYEGNRQDVTTVEEVIGSLSSGLSPDTRKVVVMDAGFYSLANITWLTSNGYDYITVLPSSDGAFVPSSDKIIRHEDCRHNEIRLQKGTVTIAEQKRNALLVDSDNKAAKESSMYERACACYEAGLEIIKSGLEKKGGTKKRDAVNKRLGRLDAKYGAIRKSYTIEMEYEGSGSKETVRSMSWSRNESAAGEVRKFHGKYVLLTSLDEDDEVNVWKFYNVIRTVEETFHVLKTDLDIRPVYHQKDESIQAHINLAVLAYWIVSVTKHRLKLKGYENVRWDEIIRIASTQVMVTAKMQTVDGDIIKIRQSTEAETKLAEIYALLEMPAMPLPKVKSVVHPKRGPDKKPS